MIAPIHPIDTHGHHIILVGLMGCGKTTIGKALSKRTGMPLLDMDSVIEEQVGKPIPEIFAESGENYFRALETALLRYLLDAKRVPTIISTGGGVVLRPENRALLRQLGFCVWLRASVKVLAVRTSYSNSRPLLREGNALEKLQKLHTERRPLYRKTAHCVLESSRLDVPTVVTSICRQADKYFLNMLPHWEK